MVSANRDIVFGLIVEVGRNVNSLAVYDTADSASPGDCLSFSRFAVTPCFVRYDPSMTTENLPNAETAEAMLQGAIGQIEFARRYTLELLDATPHEHWFTMPAGLPTNIAWQVGHLTVSQYGLLMFRVRGRKPEDLDLIPGKFRKAYGRESVPKADVATYPTPDELLARMAQVHELAIAELRNTDPSVLLEEVGMPYTAFPTKLGAILFCPLHEQIHDGQIGLLRRALGLESVR